VVKYGVVKGGDDILTRYIDHHPDDATRGVLTLDLVELRTVGAATSSAIVR